MTDYLLDTDVISELLAGSFRRRHQKIKAWLQSLGEGAVQISSVSIAEINRGITVLRGRNVGVADSIEKALGQLLSLYGDLVVTASHDDWQVYGKLSAKPELRQFGRNKNNQPRTGTDIFLAVLAVAAGDAVVTCNAKDFLVIDRYLTVTGGIINPATGEWVRVPLSECDILAH